MNEAGKRKQAMRVDWKRLGQGMACGVGVMVLMIAMVHSPSPAEQVKNKAACNQAHIEYRRTQDALSSAAEGLKLCTTGNSIHQDCATEFSSVTTAERQMQWVLREKLHPQCDPN